MGKTSRGARVCRRMAAPLAVSFFTVAAAALVYEIVAADGSRSFSSPRVGRQVLESPSPAGGSLLADVPLALLGDYFEHGLEHAPPRDPRGVMQRREAYYQPPRDPVSFLTEKLTGAKGDRGFAREIVSWSDRCTQGQISTTGRIARLEQAAAESSVDSVSLLQVAQAFEFLDGDVLATAVIRAGLVKAEQEFAATKSGGLPA